MPKNLPHPYTMTTYLYDQIMAHALQHYTDGGWDVVAECFTLQELANATKGATTLEEALKALEPLVDVWADRQADARVNGEV